MSKKKEKEVEEKVEEVNLQDEKTAELEKQLDEQKNQYMRLAAEYDNFRKRSSKEKESAYSNAKISTLKEILPVIDNLERALTVDESDGEGYKKGVEMILKQLLETMGKLGVEQFGNANDDFDPTLYNAVMHIDDENFDEQKVVEVFQKGYKNGDKVLRAAVVKVAN